MAGRGLLNLEDEQQKPTQVAPPPAHSHSLSRCRRKGLASRPKPPVNLVSCACSPFPPSPFTRVCTNAEVIIGSEEPLAVKSVLHGVLVHLVDLGLSLLGLIVKTLMLTERNILGSYKSHHRCHEHRLSHTAELLIAVLG